LNPLVIIPFSFACIHAFKSVLQRLCDYYILTRNIINCILFQENPCPHPIIILKDVGLTELKDILVYMYHGEVRVEQDRITKLLKTAQILEVRGLQDINQKLDHDLDSGVQDACSSNEEVQIQESGDDESSNSVSFHSKSVTLTSEKDTSSARHSSLKPSAAKKHRPIPMLQCIQQSGKTDFSGPSALEVDRDENCGGGTESNSSSLAPDHVSIFCLIFFFFFS
ncbi:hypothetical protein C0J52_24927, partial [Blattella germanica]